MPVRILGSVCCPGYLLWVSFLLATSTLSARPPQTRENGREHHPSKIIRSCCAFGTDLRVGPVPLLRKTDIVSRHDLGEHRYLGGPSEGNGIIYTVRGGFIDVAHVRDVADWTGYLFNLITRSDASQNGHPHDMGKEGGSKTLILQLPPVLDMPMAAELAGRIAYDLSVWHEIASWFGASYIPFIPERYSSFSPEDLYSNLLGVRLGIQAIFSDLAYEEAMTDLINQTLDTLGAVDSLHDTYLAMKKVEGLWWTGKAPLPSKKILISRYLETGDTLAPWRLDEDLARYPPFLLDKPSSQLESFFDLTITFHRLFYWQAEACLNSWKSVTQRNFNELITCISEQTEQSKPTLVPPNAHEAEK